MKTIATLQAEEAADLSKWLNQEAIPVEVRAIAQASAFDMTELWVEDSFYERACDVADSWQKGRLAEAESTWICPACKSRRLECIPNDKVEYLFRCKDCGGECLVSGSLPHLPPSPRRQAAKEEVQAKIAELKKAPKCVQLAALVAWALGLITMIRMPVAAYAAHLSVGRAFLYSLLMFTWFFFGGASLYNRSRWGYIGLVAFSALPLSGLFGWTMHLLRLTLEGTLSATWPVTFHCSVCLVQLVATVILFRYLLAKQVRDYVWKRLRVEG